MILNICAYLWPNTTYRSLFATLQPIITPTMAISMFECNPHEEATTKKEYVARNFCEQHNQWKKFHFIQPQSWQSSAFHGFVTFIAELVGFTSQLFITIEAYPRHIICIKIYTHIQSGVMFGFFSRFSNCCMQK